MGNTPSSPNSAPPPTPSLVPPLEPPCDFQCQKQKQLVTLKQNLDSIDASQDPVGYEKARIAYFTLLNGPGWLAQEKSRIAKEDVEPVLSSYRTQFESLKGEQQSQTIFTSLADTLKAQELTDEKSNSFLKKQVMMEKDKARTKDRLNELGGTPSPQTSQWLSWVIDIVIAILGIFVLYKGYTRFFGKIGMSSSPDLTTT